MYKLPYHQEKDQEIVRAFIERFPFAFLIGSDSSQRPVATQVPLFLQEREGGLFLQGHMMKNTDHHKAFVHNTNALAVFSSPHSYVSATWYKNANTASTWNYMSVHVRGKMCFVEQPVLARILQQTSLHFEHYDERSPTVFANLPEDFKKTVMQAIVGFEIAVSQIDNVFKLSQDRDKESYLNIITELRNHGDAGVLIAEEMEQRIDTVFANPDVGDS